MGYLGVFIYLLGWCLGGFTWVMAYKQYTRSKLVSELEEKERQNKIRALNPTKYGDME